MPMGCAVNLHVADVHLDGPEGPWVHVRFGSKGKPPKNGRPRKVPLFGMSLEAAREWLRVLPTYAPVNPEGLIFPTPEKAKRKTSGGRGHVGGARRQIGKTPRAWSIVKAAFGERKVWWHLLRHTAATSLLCGWWGRRWSLEEVAKLLGHSSVKVTERYAHLLDSELAGIAAESHAWWLTKRSGGGSGGSSGSSSEPSSGTSPPPESEPVAAAAQTTESFSMAFPWLDQTVAETATISLARPAGLEPATNGLEGRRSIQRRYGHKCGSCPNMA